MSSRRPRPHLPRQTQPQRRPHLDHRSRRCPNVSSLSQFSKTTHTLDGTHTLTPPTAATSKSPSASSSPACPPSRPSSANPPVHPSSPNPAPLNTPTRTPALAPAPGIKTQKLLGLRETISNRRLIIIRGLRRKRGGWLGSSRRSR